MEHLSSSYIPLVVVLVFINWDFFLTWPEIFSGEFASQCWDVETRDEMSECKRDLSAV